LHRFGEAGVKGAGGGGGGAGFQDFGDFSPFGDIFETFFGGGGQVRQICRIYIEKDCKGRVLYM